jgi:hypothetical protein
MLCFFKRIASRSEGGQPVFMGDDAVADLASGKWPGQLMKAGNAIGTFPVRVLLAAERGGASIGPGVVVRAVVGGVLTIVLSAMPRSSSSLRSSPTWRSCSIMPSVYSSSGPCDGCSALTWVRKCMRVPFHQQKNGLPALVWRVMKSLAAARFPHRWFPSASWSAGRCPRWSGRLCRRPCSGARRAGRRLLLKVLPLGNTMSPG